MQGRFAVDVCAVDVAAGRDQKNPGFLLLFQSAVVKKSISVLAAYLKIFLLVQTSVEEWLIYFRVIIVLD